MTMLDTAHAFADDLLQKICAALPDPDEALAVFGEPLHWMITEAYLEKLNSAERS